RLRKFVPSDPYILTIPQDEPKYHHYSRQSADMWLNGTPFHRREDPNNQYQTFFYHEHGSDCFTLQTSASVASQSGAQESLHKSKMNDLASGTSTPLPSTAKKKITLSAYKNKQANGATPSSAAPINPVAKSQEQPAQVAKESAATVVDVRMDAKDATHLSAKEATPYPAADPDPRSKRSDKDSAAIAEDRHDTPLSPEKARATPLPTPPLKWKDLPEGTPVAGSVVPELPTRITLPSPTLKALQMRPSVPDPVSFSEPLMPSEGSTTEPIIESMPAPQPPPVPGLDAELAAAKSDEIPQLPSKTSCRLPGHITAGLDRLASKRSSSATSSTLAKEPGRSVRNDASASARKREPDVKESESTRHKGDDERSPKKRAEMTSKSHQAGAARTRDKPTNESASIASKASGTALAESERDESPPEPTDGTGTSNRAKLHDVRKMGKAVQESSRPSLIVRLKIKKNKREDVRRMLKLPSRPDKKLRHETPAITLLRKATQSPALTPSKKVVNAVSEGGKKQAVKSNVEGRDIHAKGVAKKISPSAYSARNERSIISPRPEKRPRPAGDGASDPPAKRKKASDDLTVRADKDPSTPTPQDFKSPALHQGSGAQKTYQLTPAKKDAKSVAMRRVDSADSISISNAHTPSASIGSAIKPTVTLSGSRTQESIAWEAESKRLQALGRILKHQ
ncbi:hypothetical protein LTR66_017656, partial [Elasticomyces elasticus]